MNDMHPVAAQSLFVSKPDDFGRFVLVSLAAHASVVLVGLGISWLIAGPVIDLNEPIKATLVRKGVKRDEKLLPRKDEVPPPPPPKEAAPTNKNDLFKAMDKAATKSHGESSKDSKHDLFGAMSKAAKPAELEGDPNGDENGDSAVQEGEKYWGMLRALVRRNYDVSSTIPDAERIRLKASVTIRIGRTGELLKVDLYKPSRNDLFDQAVVAAVKKTAPFPVPPESLRDRLQTDGVQIVFTP